MGEFSSTVDSLIQAFSSGLEVIKRLRLRRKEGSSRSDKSIKEHEKRLNRSLRRNRKEVRSAFSRDRAKLGTRFDRGDTKARASLASILFRLNTGFISIIDRFTRGNSTQSDYETLVNLSNESRIEAINAFEQLSSRLSRSQLSLTPENHSSGRNRIRGKTAPSKKRIRALGGASTSRRIPKGSKSSTEPPVSKTILGPATTDGWIWPTSKRKSSPKARDSRSEKRAVQDSAVTEPQQLTKMSGHNDRRENYGVDVPTGHGAVLSPGGHYRRDSAVSFTSDSTKLGEIIDRHPRASANNPHTAFPLAPFREPRKPQSRFWRLFGRGDQD